MPRISSGAGQRQRPPGDEERQGGLLHLVHVEKHPGLRGRARSRLPFLPARSTLERSYHQRHSSTVQYAVVLRTELRYGVQSVI